MYKTQRVTKAAKVKKFTLRDWVDRGYVVPSYKSKGQGKAAEYSLNDVYYIALFKSLLDAGFSRDVSVDLIKNLKVSNFKETKYILFAIRDGKKPVTAKHDSLEQLANVIVERMDETDQIYIINMNLLKSRVDAVLEA